MWEISKKVEFSEIKPKYAKKLLISPGIDGSQFQDILFMNLF